MEILHNKIRDKVLSDSKWRKLQQDSNKSVSILLFVVQHISCFHAVYVFPMLMWTLFPMLV
jgi:hypothetical protein